MRAIDGVDFNAQKGVNGATPTVPTDIATKAYVDSVGGVITTIKTANYTANPGEEVPCDATTTSSITITLPNTPPDGSIVRVVVVGMDLALTHQVVVRPGASDGFNGKTHAASSSWSMYYLSQGVQCHYNAATLSWMMSPYMLPDNVSLSAFLGPIGDINFTNHKLYNLADATAPQDAVNLRTADARYPQEVTIAHAPDPTPTNLELWVDLDTNPLPVPNGVPLGGAIGTLLRKHSATDYDTEWQPQSGTIVQERLLQRPATAWGTTNSTAFAVLAGVTLPITKQFAGTALRCHLIITGYMTGAAGVVAFGVSPNGGTTIFGLAQFFFNELSSHKVVTDVGDLTGATVPAGALTLTLYVRVVSATQTINSDANDNLTLIVREVWP